MLGIYVLMNHQQFQARDRKTNSTLVLLTAPNHPGVPMRELTSCSIRRDPSLLRKRHLASSIHCDRRTLLFFCLPCFGI
jgi:hypothetical protein